jgi:hypothetical protein
MSHVRGRIFVIAFVAVAGTPPTVSYADDQLSGKVVTAELTLCHPRPTGGGCEGTLTLKTDIAGSSQEVRIKVTEETIIKKGPNFAYLPQTQDSSVIVTYVADKNEKLAKSINVVGP